MSVCMMRFLKMQEAIRDNIADIKKRIENAALRSGRKADDICLIAVSKTRTAQEVDIAASCGITDVGENKVQEIIAKKPQVVSDLRWHLIGHLQTNKVKSIIDKVDVIHSVDSIHLAQEINKRAEQLKTVKDILLQVNVAGEEQKFGFSPEDAKAAAYEISEKLNNVKIRGLMQIAPFAEDPEDVRIYFRRLFSFYEELKRDIAPQADMLSMGMSGDFEIAVEEGATHVRVGTAIFGERDYMNKR